ncbi:NfeD family protein [cf. Phormidesmis sp. LEGE 11477]|uniref:NfeD family protein n=1 Tax=cf. Phormidesmis sp. LEGE 11477 TaxID=1828680 RepID=UPI00188271C5|nr:NfeD family protein [cf. Phormidesmis sp. LEGE 11477]MBE9064649.1 NfeD family protein [cf. Phormidesmis sp. LEGE 11477]
MNPPLTWLIIGIGFCLMEALIPSAFLESALGVSAFGVALLSLFVPGVNYQIVLWMLLSALIFWALKRFVPNRTAPALRRATEARTTTAIQPGKIGRVIYEGNSWQARCEDRQVSIEPDQEVFVLERKGNTLIVMPLSVFQ